MEKGGCVGFFTHRLLYIPGKIRVVALNMFRKSARDRFAPRFPIYAG